MVITPHYSLHFEHSKQGSSLKFHLQINFALDVCIKYFFQQKSSSTIEMLWNKNRN
jgi:hypothetical protein